MDSEDGAAAAEERFAAVVETWRAHVDADEPESARWWLAMGLLLEQEADGEHAIEAMAQAVATGDDPDAAAWAAYQGARILGEGFGQWDEAEAMASLGLLHRPTMVELHWLSAVAAYWAEAFERSVEWAQSAIALNAAEEAGVIGTHSEFRHDPAHREGPWDALAHALAALGYDEAAAEARAQVAALESGADAFGGESADTSDDSSDDSADDEAGDLHGELPETWEDLLASPAFVITLERAKERSVAAVERVGAAGFTAVQPVAGVDGRSPEALAAAWAAMGQPPLAEMDPTFAAVGGLQGQWLSHVFLWNLIVQQGISAAVIFEDDVAFPDDWVALGTTYYEATPKEIDILHIAAQLREQPEGPITTLPSSTLAGYVITQEGARRLLASVMRDPRGMWTLPLMVEELEFAARQIGGATSLRAVTWAALDPRQEAPIATVDGGFIRNAGVAVTLGIVPSLVDETRPWFAAVVAAVDPAASNDQRLAGMFALSVGEMPSVLRTAVRSAQVAYAAPLTELMPVSERPLPLPPRPEEAAERTPTIASDGDALLVIAPWGAESDATWSLAQIDEDGASTVTSIAGPIVEALQLPNLMAVGDQWLVSGVVLGEPDAPLQLAVANLDLEAGTVADLRVLGQPEAGLAQRWWAPFAGETSLGFLARVAPTVVVDAGDGSGVLRLRSWHAATLMLSEMVAVSPAVRFGDGMLLLARDVVPSENGMVTLHRFLLIEGEAEVTMASHPFTLPSHVDDALVGMTTTESRVVLALPGEAGKPVMWEIPMAAVRSSLVALSVLGDRATFAWPNGLGVPETMRWLASAPAWGSVG